MNAMPALLNFLVLLANFLLASNADAFTSLSPAAGNQVQENQWSQFVEPMSKPTNKPNREPTKRMDLDAELPNNLSQINNAVLSNHSNQQESLADQPGIDEEIDHPIATINSSQTTPINLDSSGLRRSTTMTNQHSTAHLHSASPQSFSSACKPISTICSFQYRLSSSMVQSLAVKV
jgi:hypothetical protein